MAFTNQIIIACCILHNFCIEPGDLWDEDGDESEDDFPVRDGNADGADLRDILKEYLWNLQITFKITMSSQFITKTLFM